MSDDQRMKIYDEFHDGGFDGLLIDGATVSLFVSTFDKRRFVFIAHDVLALSVDEIVSGNIILEVATRPAKDVTEDELAERNRIRPRYSTAGIQVAELAKAQKEDLLVLTIDPSYGADALILAKSFELLTFEEWRPTLRVIS